jgi:hypothetical protein
MRWVRNVVKSQATAGSDERPDVFEIGPSAFG